MLLYFVIVGVLPRAEQLRYLIVGAYAAIYYTEPRYTKDLDILVKPEAKNAQRLHRALKEFGAPLKDITWKDFINRDIVYRIGVAPIRADIMMSVRNVGFDLAWRYRVNTTFGGVRVNIIGIKQLIRSKEKSRRDLDISDVKKLKHIV